MRHLPGHPHTLPSHRRKLADYAAQHFDYACAGGVATITLARPERKNPLTFDSYAELRIYEGASEVQQLIIARELLRAGG